MDSMIRKSVPHQVEISCLRCANRFVTPTDEEHRAIRLLCSGCSAVGARTVHTLDVGQNHGDA